MIHCYILLNKSLYVSLRNPVLTKKYVTKSRCHNSRIGMKFDNVDIRPKWVDAE